MPRTIAALGTPTDVDGTGYAFCLYEESGATPELVFEATARPGGVCAGRPCWKASGTSGWQYADKEATPLGLTQLKLKAGVDGKAQATLKGKGAPLVLPFLPLVPPIRAQLLAGNGECWEAVHDVVVKSDGTQLKAKDGP